MTTTEINKIIEDYATLYGLVIEKVKVMKSVDGTKYYTSRGINNVEFLHDEVLAICDDSFSGMYDEFVIRFPLHYLSLSDDELIVEIEKEKQLKLEKEKQLKLEKKLRDKEEKEKREANKSKKDFLLYQELKKKFDK